MDPVAESSESALFAQVDRLLGSLLLRVLRCVTSPAIRDDGDVACALCDAQGRSLIERGGNPILRGGLSAQVRALLEHVPSAWRLPADQVLLANAAAMPTSARAGETLAISEAAPVVGFVDRQTFALLVPLLPLAPGLTPAGATETAEPAPKSVLYLALCARFPRAPFGLPATPQATLRVDDLPPAAEAELTALPPAVGPRYLPFSPPPPAAPPRLSDDEGIAISPTAVADRQLSALLRRAGLPREAQNDLHALHASLLHGRKALATLLQRLGWDAAQATCQALYDRTAHTARRLLATLPAGFYAFADSLDEDGCGGTDLALRATLFLRRDGIRLDLGDSTEAAAGPVNLAAATTTAVLKEALYRLLIALDPSLRGKDACGLLPRNDGLLAGIELCLRRGSIVAAEPALAQALGGDETAARLFDVVLGALAQAAPAHVAAASAGTRSALYIADPVSAPLLPGAAPPLDRRLSLPGGVGAGPGPGAVAGALHSGGLPSIEALEASLPLRVQVLSLRADSAGLGLRSGEPGWHRELAFLRPQLVTLAGDRRRRPPYGLSGGGPAATGSDVLRRAGQGRKLPAKAIVLAQAGDCIDTDSPGGAGHGDAQRAAFFASLFPSGS